MQKIIQLGAEAEIILRNGEIIKRRIPKKYRLGILDEKIRKSRTKGEAKILEKVSKLIPVPKILRVDEGKKEIVMEFLDEKKLSENLDDFQMKKQKEICFKIGKNAAKIHDADIIHGDLTTSNMILKNNSVYFIDFGLGFISHKIEDKAVDLHLLKEVLEAKHFRNWKILFSWVLKGYKDSKNFHKTIVRLEKVESRGRYKEKY